MNITKEQIREWLFKHAIYDNGNVLIYEMDNLANLLEQCFNDLAPKWVSVDNPPSKSCKVWVNENGYFEICEYYICPEYEDAVWLDSEGEEIVPDFSFYMIIEEPEPPK